MSELEAALWLQLTACRVNGGWLPLPEREHRFDSDRKWRFDFAWPGVKLAVEVEGSVHRIKGRFARDFDKYNRAVLLGWRVLRFPRAHIVDQRAAETICEALGYRFRLARRVPRDRMREARIGASGRASTTSRREAT